MIDLPDGKKGMEIDVELRDLRWGDGTPVTAKDVAFTLEVGKHPLSGVASSEGYKRIIKLDVKDDRRFTMTIDRVTFDYNSIGLQLLPAHIEKPIFDANPAEYRNKTAYDTNSTNPGLAFGPYRIVEIVPGSRIVLEQNPTWTGAEAAFQAHRRQDHREHRGARGQPAVGQRRLRAGRARPVARPGARLREAPQGQVQRHLQAGADLRAHRRQSRQQAARRTAACARRCCWRSTARRSREKLFEGKQPIAHGGISPLDPMFSPTARQYGYDPAAARKLLDEAGFATIKNGVRHNAAGERLSIELGTTAGNRVRELVAQVIQSQLRQVGIEVRLKAEPPRIFFEAMNRRTFTGLAMYAWVQRPRGRAALVAAFQGDPLGRERLERPELSGLRQSRDGQGARRRRARARRRQAPRPVRRDPAPGTPTTCRSLPLFFRVDPFVIPKPLKGVTPTGTLNSSTLWIEQWRWEN